MANKKVRITNTTPFLSKDRPGFGLDFSGNYIGPNRQFVTELAVIPVILEEWKAKGWVRIDDADAAPVSSPGEAVVTQGTVVKEAAASEFKEDLMEEDDFFNPELAKEATLPSQTAPLMGSLNQGAQQKAKVSLGSEKEHIPVDHVSPIPGDRPRSVDDSEQFTVRAPKVDGVATVR
jgi:hypothetical protein